MTEQTLRHAIRHQSATQRHASKVTPKIWKVLRQNWRNTAKRHAEYIRRNLRTFQYGLLI
jgi:hypothetical protein